jgi:plasmid maintenance system antidote protein VapI
MRRAETLGDEITRRGLTHEQTAVLGGVQPSTINRIVAGQVRARPKTVVSLAKAFGIGAQRMQRMCEAHYFAAHPGEDLRGGGERHVTASAG